MLLNRRTVMEEETNEKSKILYTILIILICTVLGIFLAQYLAQK